MFEFKAVTYTNRNDPLSITTTTLPVTTGPDGTYSVAGDKVLVKVKLASLNPVDNFLRSAAIPYLFRAAKGFGTDYSGDVVAIGADAAAKTGLAVGDAVCGLNSDPFGKGTLAEYVLVDPFQQLGCTIHKKPKSLSYQQAAAYPLVFGTAQTMFDHSDCKDLKKVLILAAGTSVGKFLVQLAKQVYGVPEIVVTCSGTTEPEARELGATEVINYREYKLILNPVLDSVKKSGKFDLILDSAGNGDLFDNMLDILRSKQEGGTYVTIVGDIKPAFSESMFSMLFANYKSQFRAVWGMLGRLPYKYVFHMLPPDAEWAAKLARYFDEKDIKVVIDSVYPFEKFQDGLDRLVSNKARGKVVIDIY